MRYVVTGRVHPERADISFSHIQWQLPGGGTAAASCESSQITLVLDAPSIDGWITAFLAGEQLAGIVVGALGFALGSGYSLELIQVTEEDGTPHVFGVHALPAALQPRLLRLSRTRPSSIEHFGSPIGTSFSGLHCGTSCVQLPSA